MAIVATADGGTVPCHTSDGDSIAALPWQTIRSILNRFGPLNPYDPDLLQPWKVEHDSLDRQLDCYAISAKRYALYRQDLDGKRELISARDQEDAPNDESTSDEDSLTDWSEHGLGMYLDPTIKVPGKSQRDEQGRRLWIRDTWDWVLSSLDGQASPMPSWTQRYALSQFTVSSPALANWFKGYNARQPREEQIRPGSFGLIAHPDPAFYTSSAAEPAARRKPAGLPAAPFQRKPERWTTVPWYDRTTGRPLNIITARARNEPERFAHALTSGAVITDTLSNVLGRYTRRPEHKSLAPDSGAAGATTSGLLQRRPVRAQPATTLLTGKEGNKLIERLTGEVTDKGEYRNDYGPRRDPWQELVRPTVKDMGAAGLIAHGIPSATAYRILSDPRQPRATNRDRTRAAAARFARQRLAEWRLPLPADDLHALAIYQGERD